MYFEEKKMTGRASYLSSYLCQSRFSLRISSFFASVQEQELARYEELARKPLSNWNNPVATFARNIPPSELFELFLQMK